MEFGHHDYRYQWCHSFADHNRKVVARRNKKWNACGMFCKKNTFPDWSEKVLLNAGWCHWCSTLVRTSTIST